MTECGDCGIPPGGYHLDRCNVARCLFTGEQRIRCDGHHTTQLLAGQHSVPKCGADMWTGYWPGTAECSEYGWPVPPEPRPAFNRISTWNSGVTWDQVARRWRRTPVTVISDTAYVQWHLDHGASLPPGEYEIRRSASSSSPITPRAPWQRVANWVRMARWHRADRPIFELPRDQAQAAVGAAEEKLEKHVDSLRAQIRADSA